MEKPNRTDKETKEFWARQEAILKKKKEDVEKAIDGKKVLCLPNGGYFIKNLKVIGRVLPDGFHINPGNERLIFGHGDISGFVSDREVVFLSCSESDAAIFFTCDAIKKSADVDCWEARNINFCEISIEPGYDKLIFALED